MVLFHVLGADTADTKHIGIFGMFHEVDVSALGKLAHFAGVRGFAQVLCAHTLPTPVGHARSAPLSSVDPHEMVSPGYLILATASVSLSIG